MQDPGVYAGQRQFNVVKLCTITDMVLNGGIETGACVDALNPFNIRSDRGGNLRAIGGEGGQRSTDLCMTKG